MPRTLAVNLVLLLTVVPFPSASAGDPSPESRRFDTHEFLEGLKRRGLTDLLEIHLKENPPDREVDALLLTRDVKMAESVDPSRSAAGRRAALAEANRLLETVIDRNQDDPRARLWRMELGKSLLFTEADSITSSILYRGGKGSDYAELAPLMDRAISVFVALAAELGRIYDGLDGMSAPQYDKMESAGEIDKLEQDMAFVDYLLGWARFYRAVARPADSAQRRAELREVLEYLEDRSELLNTPHASNRHQGQALLLAGMADRRLGKLNACREGLARAIDVVSGISDETERRELRWVVTLARIELVRSFSDAGSFDAARGALDVFRRQTEADGAEFDERVNVALLERFVFRREAGTLDPAGTRADARALRDRGVASLSELARRDTAARDAIYAIIYEYTDESVTIETLSTLERCAILAGAIGEADSMAANVAARTAPADDPETIRLQDRRVQLLDWAVTIGESLLQPDAAPQSEQKAEAVFNLAVACHRRGRRLDAARHFLRAARDHPGFQRAHDAAVFAVQLGWELIREAPLATRDDVQGVYVDALNTLTGQWPESPNARYWRFFLAQYLAAVDRFDEAALAYDRVDPQHERYCEAVYLAVESRAAAVNRYAVKNPDDVREISRQAAAAMVAARSAQEQLERALAATDSKDRSSLANLAARCALVHAELCIINGVNQWDRAIETLKSFEERYPGQSTLIGRVLRARMIALESLGRLDEAANLIPRYVANDPQGAVPTLQGLLDAIRAEITRDRSAGRNDEATARAKSAVTIAEGMYQVAREPAGTFDAAAVYALRLQFAEALLDAEQHSRASELFQQCVTEDAARHPDGQARDSRALSGAAESDFQLKRYGEALPVFNRLFRGAQQGESMWWKALLRDLQCRTELGEPPADIIKVIQQRKFLDSNMGGPELRRKFDALLTQNERRAEGRS